MDHKRITAVEYYELMLASAFDAVDTLSFHRSRSRGRKLAPECRVERSDGLDGFADGSTSQRARGTLDFG